MSRDAITINPKTGEVYQYGRFRTDKQIRASKEYFEKLKNKEITQKNLKYRKYGSFVWFLYNSNEILRIGVTPANLTRLIFISTYMDYKNKLVTKDKTPMDKKIMFETLKISKRTFDYFYLEMISNNIFIEKENEIYLTNSLFSKGKIDNTDFSIEKIRLYVRGVRQMYNNATPREHKMLSYLFQAIPFINTQYNVICYNPHETIPENIKPMTLLDFCKTINYDTTSSSSLSTKLLNVSTAKEYAFAITKSKQRVTMIVNPKIYFAGSDYKKVEIYASFFKKMDITTPNID